MSVPLWALIVVLGIGCGIVGHGLARVLLVFLVSLVIAASAFAAPTPQPAPSGHHHKITWVAYNYREFGKDSTGHRYYRWCHVTKRGHRTCGAWHEIQP